MIRRLLCSGRVNRPLCWACVAVATLGFLGCQQDEQKPIAAEQRDFDGLTAMHRAASNGDVAELERMLSIEHANPNLRDAAQVTPIHYAARNGQLEAIRMLVSYGAEPNAKTHNGWTALQLAMREGHLDCVHFLSQYGFDPNGTTPEGEVFLVYALRTQNDGMAEFLIERGADINVRNEFGKHLIDEAFNERNVPVINMMLDYDVELPRYVPGQRSPLQRAVEWGDATLVNRLLVRGADPLERDSGGRNAYDLAVDLGYPEIAEQIAYYVESQQAPRATGR